jgi:hypothetical protein
MARMNETDSTSYLIRFVGTGQESSENDIKMSNQDGF